MPIKGLTDRGLSFPEIGQIRKGGEKESNRPGKDLDYFRITLDEKETEAKKILHDRYGDQPREINILLPFNEIERNWEAWLEAYNAGQMIARSDGETYLYRVDPKTGEVLTRAGRVIPYVEGEILYKTDKTVVKCHPVGRLKVLIPELQRLVYLTVLTTSVNDIRNISGQLEALYQLTGGKIAGVPLVLRRRPKMISCPNANGGRTRREKWMLSIEADPSWVKAKLMEVKKLALPGNGLALLPAPAEEPEVETVSEPEPEEEWDPTETIEGEVESEPEPQAGPTAEEIAWAGAMLTPKGRPFAELTDSQLQYIIEHAKSEDDRRAAGILIDARIELEKQKKEE